MKCSKSQIKSALALITLVSLSGCLSYNPQVTDSGYSFKNKPNYGLVAFTMTCDGDWRSIHMFGIQSSQSLTHAVVSAPIDLEIPCDGQRQYVLLSLEKGTYSFFNIAPKNQTNVSPNIMTFNSTPQQVNYLGAFHVKTRYQKKALIIAMFVDKTDGVMAIGLNNELPDDIQFFRNHYQNIPALSYKFVKVTKN